MTKAEFVDAGKAITLILSTLTGISGGTVRLLELAKEIELSKVALDPWLWLCAVATLLPVYLGGRIKFSDEKIVDAKQTSSADSGPGRHEVEKHDFEIKPLGINMGEAANPITPVTQTEKPKIGTVGEDDVPDLMDNVLNQAIFGAPVQIIHLSKTKKK